jgi:hypothetical protein
MPAAIAPAAPLPIKSKPTAAALPPAYAGGLNGSGRRPAAPASQAGQWEEF